MPRPGAQLPPAESERLSRSPCPHPGRLAQLVERLCEVQEALRSTRRVTTRPSRGGLLERTGHRACRSIWWQPIGTGALRRGPAGRGPGSTPGAPLGLTIGRPWHQDPRIPSGRSAAGLCAPGKAVARGGPAKIGASGSIPDTVLVPAIDGTWLPGTAQPGKKQQAWWPLSREGQPGVRFPVLCETMAARPHESLSSLTARGLCCRSLWRASGAKPGCCPGGVPS